MRPVVAQAAVQQDHEGPYVLVVDSESRVVVRRVKTGRVFGGMWAIESGLNAGELVMVEGIQKVQPGMTVKSITADNGQGR
jgi:membrane fusion protein (multidrug efflux system)